MSRELECSLNNERSCMIVSLLRIQHMKRRKKKLAFALTNKHIHDRCFSLSTFASACAVWFLSEYWKLCISIHEDSVWEKENWVVTRWVPDEFPLGFSLPTVQLRFVYYPSHFNCNRKIFLTEFSPNFNSIKLAIKTCKIMWEKILFRVKARDSLVLSHQNARFFFWPSFIKWYSFAYEIR